MNATSTGVVLYCEICNKEIGFGNPGRESICESCSKITNRCIVDGKLLKNK